MLAVATNRSSRPKQPILRKPLSNDFSGCLKRTDATTARLRMRVRSDWKSAEKACRASLLIRETVEGSGDGAYRDRTGDLRLAKPRTRRRRLRTADDAEGAIPQPKRACGPSHCLPMR
jgi:hypothetical protein